MKINDTNISTYNAQLLGYKLSNSNITTNSSSNHIYFNSEIGEKQLSIRLFVKETSREDIEITISKLTNALKGKNIISFTENENMLYDCIYNSSAIEDIVYNGKILTYTFKAIQTSTENTVIISALTTTITLEGTDDIPCIIEITPIVDIEEFTINDITITNLTSNEKVIINGEKITVTEEGVNKFGDTNITEFPKLNLGTNTITVSDITNANTVIKYKNRYI